MDYRDAGVVVLLAVAVTIMGSLISYPPYAKLAGLTTLLAGLGLLALRQGEEQGVGEERLERDSGEGPE